MSGPTLDEDSLQHATPVEIHSALFAQLVTGHAQMAMMLLGKFPNPQTGMVESPAPEGAKVFIDQLEMIEVKTRGNLSSEEARLLAQMLGATRISFAEVMDAQIAASEEASLNPPLAMKSDVTAERSSARSAETPGRRAG